MTPVAQLTEARGLWFNGRYWSDRSATSYSARRAAATGAARRVNQTGAGGVSPSETPRDRAGIDRWRTDTRLGLGGLSIFRRVRRPARTDRSRLRVVASWALTILALLLVWFPLTAPDPIGAHWLETLVRIPLEALALAALVLVLRPWPRRLVAALVGVVLGVLTIVRILDTGFYQALGRPFNPVIDGTYFHSAFGLLRDSIGSLGAIASTLGAGILLAAVLVLTPLSVLRLTRALHRHRTASIRTATALVVVWVVFALTGVAIVAGSPVASTSAVVLAFDRTNDVGTGLAGERAFKKAAAVDSFRDTPAGDLLTGLRGKDVIFAFVESYGRVAVADSSFSPQVNAVLDNGTKQLQAAGFSSRSAFLTSPTFGGISWLAHSTLQSGLWIDDQKRYDDLVAGDRFTLSDAFGRAGWRTVADIPSNREDWPQGKSFYHYDKIYDARNVGYKGPDFSYASMPDQYVLSAFQRLELGVPDHPPVMAEIDLVSSHGPWAPIPHMIDWNALGDGSVFNKMEAQGQSPESLVGKPDQVRTAYGQSIQYSLTAMISFLQTFHDPNLVVVMLGDHQPATIVSGTGASHDVPITIIAHDPAVLSRINSWGWQDGLRPAANAPVWPMDAFRDRFLTAYGPSR